MISRFQFNFLSFPCNVPVSKKKRVNIKFSDRTCKLYFRRSFVHSRFLMGSMLIIISFIIFCHIFAFLYWLKIWFIKSFNILPFFHCTFRVKYILNDCTTMALYLVYSLAYSSPASYLVLTSCITAQFSIY
jgi:hypothetical protein